MSQQASENLTPKPLGEMDLNSDRVPMLREVTPSRSPFKVSNRSTLKSKKKRRSITPYITPVRTARVHHTSTSKGVTSSKVKLLNRSTDLTIITKKEIGLLMYTLKKEYDEINDSYSKSPKTALARSQIRARKINMRPPTILTIVAQLEPYSIKIQAMYRGYICRRDLQRQNITTLHVQRKFDELTSHNSQIKSNAIKLREHGYDIPLEFETTSISVDEVIVPITKLPIKVKEANKNTGEEVLKRKSTPPPAAKLSLNLELLITDESLSTEMGVSGLCRHDNQQASKEAVPIEAKEQDTIKFSVFQEAAKIGKMKMEKQVSSSPSLEMLPSCDAATRNKLSVVDTELEVEVETSYVASETTKDNSWSKMILLVVVLILVSASIALSIQRSSAIENHTVVAAEKGSDEPLSIQIDESSDTVMDTAVEKAGENDEWIMISDEKSAVSFKAASTLLMDNDDDHINHTEEVVEPVEDLKNFDDEIEVAISEYELVTEEDISVEIDSTTNELTHEVVSGTNINTAQDIIPEHDLLVENDASLNVVKEHDIRVETDELVSETPEAALQSESKMKDIILENWMVLFFTSIVSIVLGSVYMLRSCRANRGSVHPELNNSNETLNYSNLEDSYQDSTYDPIPESSDAVDYSMGEPSLGFIDMAFSPLRSKIKKKSTISGSGKKKLGTFKAIEESGRSIEGLGSALGSARSVRRSSRVNTKSGDDIMLSPNQNRILFVQDDDESDIQFNVRRSTRIAKSRKK